MGSRITITPPDGNTAAGQYDLRGLITGKPKTSALESLYGQDYLKKTAAMKEKTGGGYGFVQESLGPIADEFGAGISAAADYIYGGVTGNPQEFGRLYDERLGSARSEQEAYREANPVKSIAANVAGGMSIAPAKALQAATAIPGILGRIGLGAKAGAVGGGLAGFAEGKGGAVNRGRTAALGGAAGAALGGAIPLATGTISTLSRGVMNGLGISGRGAESRARKMFLDALKSDGVELKDIAAITSDRPLTLADLGENSRALLGKAYRGSEEGRKIISDFLGERQAAQFGRVTEELSEGIGQKPAAFAQTADDLVTARRANAKTTYTEAYKGVVKVDENMRDLLRRTDTLGASSTGRRLGEADGVVFPDDLAQADEIGVDALDYLTRGLNDTGPRGSNENRIAMNLARQIEEASPDLIAARHKYASDSALMDALDEGRKFMRGDTEGVGRALGAMSEAEQDLYRLGAARELYGKLGKVRDQNDIARFFENPDMRDRLKEVFPDRPSFEKFMAAVDEESAMNLTRNKVMSGSQTAERLADDSRMASDVAGFAGDTAKGGLSNAVLNAGTKLAGRANERFLQGVNEKTGSALARLGTRTDLGDIAPRMAMPGPRVENLPDVSARVPGLGQVQPSPAGVAAGGLVGRGLTPDEPVKKNGSRIQISPPAESRIQIESQSGPSNIKTTGKHVDLGRLNAPVRDKFVALQRRWGAELPVSSAYRSPEYNAKVGGAKKSQHMHGDAMDIDLSGMPPDKRLRLINMASEAGFTGIGIYDGSIHLDVGGRRAWGPSRKSDSIPRWAKTVIDRHLKRQG